MIMESRKETFETQEKTNNEERGSAIVIALFVLALVSAFAALAITRTATEAAAVGNEAAEGRTFYAAQGSLEMMTRNFNKVFEVKLSPTLADLAIVRDGNRNPGLSTAMGGQYTFVQEVDQTSTSRAETLTGGPFSGLYALRDNWRLRTTATDTMTGVQVQLTRNILNNRIPIFQFGVFYDDDLELFRPPRFSFGGRVHSNRHFFVSPGSEGVYFDSRVTAVGEIITQTWRNGYTGDSANSATYIKNASGVFKQFLPTYGSVLNGTPNVFASDPDLPPSRVNPSFSSQTAIFDGNIAAHVKPLKLPLKVGDDIDLIEMIRRGKQAPGATPGDYFTGPADNDILRSERFANKTGIRVSLADSKLKLPGCAATSTTAVTGKCGVRLDGYIDGLGLNPNILDSVLNLRARGYQPKPMKLSSSDPGFNYVPTRVNGERLFTGSPREVWIKVETVRTNPVDGSIIIEDITEDILALGVTEQPITWNNFGISGYNHTRPDNSVGTGSNLTATTPQPPSQGTDSRSIIKIQRFLIPGATVPSNPSGSPRYVTGVAGANSGENYSAVVRYSGATAITVAAGCVTGCTVVNPDPNSSPENYAHLKLAKVGSTTFDKAIVPFPIEMWDAREGEYYDQRSTTYYPNTYFDNPSGTPRKISRNGVMSMIDIDVANLRRFLRGDFDGLFPVDTLFAIAKGRGLRSTDIPDKNGWVLYISDRRGDQDFDGEFDMEDIYGSAPGNDGIKQKGEDVNNNGILDMLTGSSNYEAARYRDDTIYPDQGAVNDHKYYRRGVRLINAVVLPGIYDASNPSNTKGFTVASENGVYVKGNYNATGVASVPSSGNTPYNQYLPFDTPLHIPASIVADAVTILSNSKFDNTSSGAALGNYTDGWNDGESFSSPYDQSVRAATTTQIRFAMIAGDTIASLDGSPNQGGISPRLNGGVHNFKRFLETWTGQRLDYAGSLINLYNSRNNNGSFKCCNTVYNPPIRNWVFDSTFLDPTRLPPGSPFFQYVQTTGFERTND